jgi:hypothetical protein
MAITDNTALAKKAAAQPLVELQPRGATNIRVPLAIAATGVPQQCVSIPVAPGLTVTLIGVVGQAVNAHDVWVADNRQELLAGTGRRVPAGSEVEFPVDNTGRIWYIGTAADGLLVTVTGVAVG